MSFSVLVARGAAPVFGPGEAAAAPTRGGFAATPFGLALLIGAADTLHWLSFLDAGEEETAWREGLASFSKTAITRDDTWAAALAGPWFVRSQVGALSPPVRLCLRGTGFQESVWRALLALPSGKTQTYGELAAALGRPTAARAVGSAVGRNPIAWIIPCHRIVPAMGGGGYRWGPDRKQSMLAWEQAG